VRDLLKLKVAGLPHEVFVCLQLDAQHRVIAIEELFRGTHADERLPSGSREGRVASEHRRRHLRA